MKITQITNEHLLNRIKYFEKRLSERPAENAYMGISDYGEDWAEQEDRHNEEVVERITAHIEYMKAEAKKRSLSL